MAPHANGPIMSIISGDIGIAKSKFSIFTQGCLVQIFTTRGVVVPPENNLIMSGTSIRLFRHLEHQNPSIISEDIGRVRSVQQFWRNEGTEEEEAYSCLRG